MQATNGNIGTEPFKTNDVKTINVGGFAKVGQKHELTPLKVVIGNNNYLVGSIIYVLGETCKAPWAAKVYKVNGMDFILVPEASVQLVSFGE